MNRKMEKAIMDISASLARMTCSGLIDGHSIRTSRSYHCNVISFQIQKNIGEELYQAQWVMDVEKDLEAVESQSELQSFLSYHVGGMLRDVASKSFNETLIGVAEEMMA